MKDNIGIDLDGVVCDIYSDALKVLKEMYPDNVKEEVIGYGWEKAYNLTDQQVMNCFIEIGKRRMLKRARIS